MKLSASEENYIKHIFHLSDGAPGVSSSVLAQRINIKAASVTEMLRRLNRKKIIHYKPYCNFTLTELGNKLALNIIRRHRLWEYFLVEKLGFNWHEVHEIAEELEHVSSTELVQRLDKYLDFPSIDPHGDPIPDRNLKMKTVKQSSLSAAPLKKTIIVNAFSEQTADMHQVMQHFRIGIGTKLKVVRHFDFDGSVEIKIEKQPAAVISSHVAKNIYCIV